MAPVRRPSPQGAARVTDSGYVVSPSGRHATHLYNRAMQHRLLTVAFITLGLAGPLIESGSLLSAQDLSEKNRLLTALRALAGEIAPFNRDPQPLRQAALDSTSSLRWLQNATEAWKPASVDDGRPMRVAIERMVLAMRGAPNDAARRNLLPPIDDDLEDKVAYCRKHGLSSTRQVTVVTKRGAVTEVSGLEVLYLEKFLENDPRVMPRQFRGFSSPATDELAPGRYVVWAREPPTGKEGPRKEGRVSLQVPSGPIEVLAP